MRLPRMKKVIKVDGRTQTWNLRTKKTEDIINSLVSNHSQKLKKEFVNRTLRLRKIFAISGHKRRVGDARWRVSVNIRQTGSMLSHRQMNISSNGSFLFCCSVKGHIFVEKYFIAKRPLVCIACPMKREWKQRKNSISTLKSVRVRLRESVRLQERENTESNWEA